MHPHSTPLSLHDIAYLDSLRERFWSRVDQSGDCWIWTGQTTKSGAMHQTHYGTITVTLSKGKYRPCVAHRVSYLLAHGEIPPGSIICHRCDNPLCVRPEHLYAGTALDNSRDCWGRGRGRPGSLPGERNASARLKAHHVVEIRRRRANGEKLAALGNEYGVSDVHIARICLGQSWRHLK